MHGITKTFRRKTEELEHPVQLCIYISNHNVTQSILFTWTQNLKRVFLQARQKKNFIFCLTQQKQKAFFFSPQYLTFFAEHTSTEMYIHTPAHKSCVNNLWIPLIVSPGNASPYWCSPFTSRSRMWQCTPSVRRPHTEKYYGLLLSLNLSLL